MKTAALLACLLAAAVPASPRAAEPEVAGARKDGRVQYVGAQRDIFASGKAGRVMSLEALAGRPGLYAIGPVEGLDGEITILDSAPYVTKVRGGEVTMDRSLAHGAIFLVWAEQTQWRDVKVPPTVAGYLDLQAFVKAQAKAAGLDVTKPFPFLLAGVPREVRYHVNVDRTDGQPISQELFARSKQGFVLKAEPVDVVGFYAEGHAGEFVTAQAPAIPQGSGIANAIHLHVVARSGKIAGHVDDLTLSGDVVLRLPR